MNITKEQVAKQIEALEYAKLYLHCAETMLSVLESLWNARNKLAATSSQAAQTALQSESSAQAAQAPARLPGEGKTIEALALTEAQERVPMTEEVALKIAHRRATTYTHRSDPRYSGYAFVPYTLMDFVRDLEAHHNITPPESKG